ncbi:MAG: hypothetical protein ACT4TC_21920 [Myxococcaceae bacterium]
MVEDPRHLVAVFKESFLEEVLVDAVWLTVKPVALPAPLTFPLKPSEAIVAKLNADGLLKNIRGRRMAQLPWDPHASAPTETASPEKEEDLRSNCSVLTQSLGDVSGRGNRVGASVHTNILRRVRDRLTAEGKYFEPSLAPGATSANYVDRRYLATGIDLHRECLSELLALVKEVRTAYIYWFERIFGVPLSPDQVRVSVQKIELTFDVHSEIARHAITEFLHPWLETFVGAGIKTGFFNRRGEKRPSMMKATGYENTFAVRGTGVLFARAHGKRRQSAKLYVKHDRLIRFEATYWRKRAWRVMRQRNKNRRGAAIRLDTFTGLESDLRVLAEAPYRTLLATQEALVCDAPLDFPDLIARILPKGSAKVVKIIRALYGGGPFHNKGEAYTKQLDRLRAANVVGKPKHGGEYQAVEEVKRTFELIRWRLRHGGAR